MRLALTTIHASALVLVLGCQCAQAAAPEQRDRESPRAAPPAAAQGQGQARGEQRNERSSQPAQAAPRNDSRQFESRQQDGRTEEVRRQESGTQGTQGTHQNGDAFRRNGRLTPDERRDLRRQINEAGQDIYRNTPRR